MLFCEGFSGSNIFGEEETMPTIRIQGKDLTYEEKDIIKFDEGLIGMPHLQRMVLINNTEIAPFFLLCSLDDSQINFLVLEANTYFPNYSPHFSEILRQQLGIGKTENPLVLVTVTIASEWIKSTINLRAPIVVAAATMQGAQVVLSDSQYQLAEPLPVAWTVAGA